MKAMEFPELAPDFPKVLEQQALKKQIDARKTEILKNMLLEFMIYLRAETNLMNPDKSYRDYHIDRFLKKVGQK